MFDVDLKLKMYCSLKFSHLDKIKALARPRGSEKEKKA